MPKQIAYPEIRDWYKAGLDSNNKNLYIFWVQYNNAESYDTKNDNKLKKALPKISIFLAGRPPLAPLSSGTDSVWGRAKDSGKDWGRDMGREKDKESGRAKVSESGRARVNVSVRARERDWGRERAGGGGPSLRSRLWVTRRLGSVLIYVTRQQSGSDSVCGIPVLKLAFNTVRKQKLNNSL